MKATEHVNPGQFPVLTVDHLCSYAIANVPGHQAHVVLMGGLHIEMAFLCVVHHQNHMCLAISMCSPPIRTTCILTNPSTRDTGFFCIFPGSVDNYCCNQNIKGASSF